MRLVELAYRDSRAGIVGVVLVVAWVTGGCGGRSARSDQTSSGGSSVGGRASNAGTSAGGGSTGASSGGSAADERSCTEDTDCRQCLYAAFPANIAECEHSLGCCGGQVLNATTCAVNKAAFERVCAGQNVMPPICPCIIPGTDCTLACRDGECGFECKPPADVGGGAAQ